MERSLKQLLVSSLHDFLQKVQEKPSNDIQREFFSKYPDAVYPYWSRIDKYKWKIDFSLNYKEQSTFFDNDGNWMETRTMTLFDLMPSQVKSNFLESYIRNDDLRVYRVLTPNEILFEFHYKNDLKSLRLLYDLDGKLLNINNLEI